MPSRPANRARVPRASLSAHSQRTRRGLMSAADVSTTRRRALVDRRHVGGSQLVQVFNRSALEFLFDALDGFGGVSGSRLSYRPGEQSAPFVSGGGSGPWLPLFG